MIQNAPWARRLPVSAVAEERGGIAMGRESGTADMNAAIFRGGGDNARCRFLPGGQPQWLRLYSSIARRRDDSSTRSITKN
jgi:hypothetical protein